MSLRFNAAAGRNGTTTAGAMAQEMGRFGSELARSASLLRAELAGMEKARADMREEAAHNAGLFARQTVTALDSEHIETVDEIGKAVEELAGQGLAFYRNKLLGARDAALQAVNATLPHTVDAAGFCGLMTQAAAAHEAALAAQAQAQNALDAAQKDLQAWEEHSLEDDLVRLDAELQKKGEFSLSAARAAYEPANVFVAAYKWAFGGGNYRQVRTLLAAYGHGRDGKDAFADLANFKSKYDRMHGAVAQAQEAVNSTGKAARDTGAAKDALLAHAAQIRLDAQLLGDVQGKLATDVQASGPFVKALADHYQEDFPKALPLMLAKIGVLARIEAGTRARLASIEEAQARAAMQQGKLAAVRGTTKIKGDLDEIRARHEAIDAANDNYARSSGRLWQRTRDYAGGGAEMLPGALEILLISELLEGALDAPFAAALMGIDKAAAAAMALPAAVIDAVPEALDIPVIDGEAADIVDAVKSAVADVPGGGDLPDLPDLPDAGGGGGGFDFDIDLDIF